MRVSSCTCIHHSRLTKTVPACSLPLLTCSCAETLQGCAHSLAADVMKHPLNSFGVTYCCCCNCAVVPSACRAMPQYVQKGPDGRQPMDSVLNFPMYYKLNDVFAYQQDMRM